MSGCLYSGEFSRGRSICSFCYRMPSCKNFFQQNFFCKHLYMNSACIQQLNRELTRFIVETLSGQWKLIIKRDLNFCKSLTNVPGKNFHFVTGSRPMTTPPTILLCVLLKTTTFQCAVQRQSDGNTKRVGHFGWKRTALPKSAY